MCLRYWFSQQQQHQRVRDTCVGDFSLEFWLPGAWLISKFSWCRLVTDIAIKRWVLHDQKHLPDCDIYGGFTHCCWLNWRDQNDTERVRKSWGDWTGDEDSQDSEGEMIAWIQSCPLSSISLLCPWSLSCLPWTLMSGFQLVYSWLDLYSNEFHI